jgi:hypothetical protein
MVPDEYRVINRAICMLEDDLQDEREKARAALHALFRKQLILELMIYGLGADPVTGKFYTVEEEER